MGRTRIAEVDEATAWSLGIWVVLCVLLVFDHIGWRKVLSHQGLASWVQALGSVAAIATAIWISNRQHHLDRLEAKAADDQRASRLISAVLLCVQRSKGLAEVVRKAAGLHKGDADHWCGLVQRERDLVRSIPIHDLPSLVAFQAISTTMTQLNNLEAVIRRWERDTAMGPTGLWKIDNQGTFEAIEGQLYDLQFELQTELERVGEVYR